MKANLGPAERASKHSLHTLLLHKFLTEYGYTQGSVIAEAIVSDILATIASCYQEHLSPRQVIWLAVRRETIPARKAVELSDLVPVRLTIVTDEELLLLNDAALRTQRIAQATFQQHRLARWCHEAYEQNGVLSQLDLSLLTGVSEESVSRHLQAHERATGEVVPIRGTVHDLGQSVTHKAEVVRRYLRGDSPRDIARALHHSQQAVDDYLRDYQKVRMLAPKFPAKDIPLLAAMSRRLVTEYLRLLAQYEPSLPLYNPTDNQTPADQLPATAGH